MNKVNLNIAHEKIAEFCKANRIRRLALLSTVLQRFERECSMKQHDTTVRIRHMLDHAKEAVALLAGKKTWNEFFAGRFP